MISEIAQTLTLKPVSPAACFPVQELSGRSLPELSHHTVPKTAGSSAQTASALSQSEAKDSSAQTAAGSSAQKTSVSSADPSVFCGCPPASDRDAWDGLPEDLKQALIRAGEQYLGQPYAPVTMKDFMEFSRTGNRVHYEDKLFSRMTALDALVLAECAEYQGRFLDDIINGVFLLCEESAWQLPAHNSYERNASQEPLPDVTRPVLDLFAAEAGAILAVTEYLLRNAFAQVSPFISKAVNRHLETRIFRPYLEQHFWWMGDGVSPMNNWTSWCTQNVLLAAFTRDSALAAASPDAPTALPGMTFSAAEWQENRQRMFQKASRSLDYFLEAYGEDGCCDEGAQYYRHAALTFFEAAEVLNDITGGAFSAIYREPKICNMAAYIRHVHVAGPYYLNFADCSPIAGRCGAREYLFGKRTGDPELAAFAARDYQNCDMETRLSPEEHNLFYRVQSVFAHREMMAYAADHPQDTGEPACRSRDIFYPSAGLFIARDSRYCLAVKAGDNDDSHNHNDTGSFILYKDGQPLFIDLGVESYTQKTFSSRRYEIWTMQSAWHNLPTFGEIMQKDGPQYASSDVTYNLGNSASCISMDIARAYPDPRILSYVRTARLEKGKQVVIRDRFRLAEPMPVTLSLITCVRPAIRQDSGGLALTLGELAVCRVAGVSQAEVEEVPITDPRLGIAWKGSIYRTLLTPEGDSCALTIV